jgi:Flp pilus assembly protein TadD
VPLLLAVAAYARVLHGELVFDDIRQIAWNPRVRDLGAALAGFLPDLLHGRRPVTLLTFALNHAAGGLDPFGYHLVNLALHLGVSALAFLFARAVLRLAGAARPDGLAVAVAGLFALHPLQSQAVSYVVQRAEVLASGFYLATLLLLLVAERRGRTPAGAAAVVAALACFALGLGSKAIAVTLPAAWLLLAAVVPGPEARPALAGWRTRLALVVPLLALAAWFTVGTLGRIEGATDAGFSVPGLPARAYLLTQLRVLVTYLGLLFWPAGQSADWAFSTSRSLGDPGVLASGLLLVALAAGAVALAWRSRRREDPDGAAARLAAFGVLWFLVVLSASSSVVPRDDVLVEHRTYLASLGIFLAVAVAAERLLSRLAGGKRAAAALLLVGGAWAALALVLHARNAVWESDLALWSDAAAKAPAKPRPLVALANARLKRGDAEGAIRDLTRARTLIRSGEPFTEFPIVYNLGTALLRAGRDVEAVAPLRRAVELDPTSPDAAVALGVALLGTGQLAEAEAWATRGLELRPDLGLALQVLGRARLEAGDAAGALGYLERAAAASPADLGLRRQVEALRLGVAAP